MKTKFSSILNAPGTLKAAVTVIAVIIVMAAAGTFIPDNTADTGSPARGTLRFCFPRGVYHSPIFYTALCALFLSLARCTGKRILYIFRTAAALKTITPDRLDKTAASSPIKLDVCPGEAAIKHSLVKRGLSVRSVKTGESAAYTGRSGLLSFSGSLLTHLGIMFILAGAAAGGIFGFSVFYSAEEGKTLNMPGNIFSLKIDGISDTAAAGGNSSAPECTVTVIKEGLTVRKADIGVNHPLRYMGLSIYAWPAAAEASPRSLNLSVSAGGLAKSVKVKPGEFFDAGGGLRGRVTDFYNDFVLDASGRPANRSKALDNPAALIKLEGAAAPAEIWAFLKHGTVLKGPGGAYPGIALTGVDTVTTSELQVKRAPGRFLLWAGFALLAAGLPVLFIRKNRFVFIISNGNKIFISGRPSGIALGIGEELMKFSEKPKPEEAQ